MATRSLSLHSAELTLPSSTVAHGWRAFGCSASRSMWLDARWAECASPAYSGCSRPGFLQAAGIEISYAGIVWTPLDLSHLAGRFPKIFRNTALGRMPTDSSSLNRTSCLRPISTVPKAANGSEDERPRRKEQEIRTGSQGLDREWPGSTEG